MPFIFQTTNPGQVTIDHQQEVYAESSYTIIFGLELP